MKKLQLLDLTTVEAYRSACKRETLPIESQVLSCLTVHSEITRNVASELVTTDLCFVLSIVCRQVTETAQRRRRTGLT
jgi:hypothetical protein